MEKKILWKNLETFGALRKFIYNTRFMVTQIMDAQHLLRVLPNISQILVAASYQLQPTTTRGCFSEVLMASCTISSKALCLWNFGFFVFFVRIFFLISWNVVSWYKVFYRAQKCISQGLGVNGIYPKVLSSNTSCL